MNQILRCDWLPELARWSYVARSDIPAVSRIKNFPESHIIILVILGSQHLFNFNFNFYFMLI